MTPAGREREHVRFLIIGAGPTGLGAAYRLRELGTDDYLVVEAAGHVGGLASSVRDAQGFVWDIGVHVLFSHYAYFDRVMDEALAPSEWVRHERQSWVWLRERFIPYPIQNNIRHLPEDDLLACLKGLLALRHADASGDPRHFRDWIHAAFGAGLAAVFMEPYNVKAWAYPTEQMSWAWIGDRVATMDLERVLENVVRGRDDPTWGPNHVFRYPRRGGTGAIWGRVADRGAGAKIRLGFEVAEIDAGARWVRATDGRVVHYDVALSTMPLDRLTAMIRDLPATLKAAGSRLHFSSTHVVGIGLEGPKPPALDAKSWVYFPDPGCPFYRVTIFSNYSPGNVPDPSRHWSLIAETSESCHRPVVAEAVVEDTLAGLRRLGWIGPSVKVVSTWHHRATHGYPTPSIERDEILTLVHPELHRRGLFSRGRFGGWKYEVSNQDHSFMQGVEWVDHVIKGEEEVTLFHPARVNASRNGHRR